MLMLYFSGTGNSKFIASKFSQQMKCECHSIEEQLPFHSIIKAHKTIAFCYPVYGSRVPRIMREFVSAHLDNLKRKKVIIFCTQLMFSGDGARAFTDLIPVGHCKYIYAEHFNMPNNISNFPILPITSKRHNHKIKMQAWKKLLRACYEIQNGAVRLRGFSPFSKLLGLSQGLLWPSMEHKMKDQIKIDTSCIQCQKCVKCCPVENLKLENGKIIANDNCICCYRCINQCPQKSIYGLFGGKVRKQYQENLGR